MQYCSHGLAFVEPPHHYIAALCQKTSIQRVYLLHRLVGARIAVGKAVVTPDIARGRGHHAGGGGGDQKRNVGQEELQGGLVPALYRVCVCKGKVNVKQIERGRV